MKWKIGWKLKMLRELIKLQSSSTEAFFASSLEMTIGETIKEILLVAQMENRLICGLSNASSYFKESENAEHSLFFFIAQSSTSDSLAHIQEVILQSFCFENDIYIVKLDSVAKLNKILGCEQGCDSCALVQKLPQTKNQSRKERYTELENILIDHCEDFWDELVQPVIKLPEKWSRC